MPETLRAISYIAASALFIMSLGGLSNQETARRGNWFGIVGMIIALVATAFRRDASGYGLLIATLIGGAAIGAVLAARVKMTAMPQLVAILHSFVGLAAVLVGIATYLDPHAMRLIGAERSLHLVEIYLGVCIGSITFTGSVIAFGKLQGFISGNPVLIPGRHLINLALAAVVVWFAIQFHNSEGSTGLWPLLIATTIAGIFGVHFVMAIGGADMPVVVSMLNSYSGWAAAAAGFMLANDLLIITGALVGSSGAILSFIMCRGMNRSFLSVILGGFGTQGGKAPAGPGLTGEVRSVDATRTAEQLRSARKVVIVPGYGLAVAQAQHAISSVTQHLRDRGTHVRFAIHPVAGRLPGHMNVLLAEANVPYDIVHEMEEINDTLHEVDTVLVIGANDIVNPSAIEDPDSPIAGMPVLEVWKARTVIVMKRGMASGYAGVENPLFFRENTVMLFGDALKNVDLILAALRG
jgi:H+-translocating NAD(P) transhydrogenase subunit beta